MKKLHVSAYLIISTLLLIVGTANARDTTEEYLREYPNQEQVKMMNAWLEKNEKGTFKFTGLVDPSDATVVTPQATVDYGYNWFSVSDGPAVVRTPQYDKFFSVSIFDMLHNKLLIPNDKKIYDRTTYSSEPNDDGTYTLTLSPSGDGKNGIPTGGKDFYGLLRAYVPVPGAVMKVNIEKK